MSHTFSAAGTARIRLRVKARTGATASVVHSVAETLLEPPGKPLSARRIVDPIRSSDTRPTMMNMNSAELVKSM